METLEPFVLRQPRTLAEAAAMLREPGARLLAGGTDLVPNLRHGLERPAVLIDARAIEGFGSLREEGTALVIGAGTTLAALALEPRVRERFPALGQAAASIAGPAHRSVATLGGNLCLDTRCVFYNQSEWWRRANQYCLKRGGEICHVAPHGKRCHAAFSGDLAPALLVLGAEVDVATPSGSRRVPLAELYREDGAQHLTLAPGELIAAIRLPQPATGMRSAYRKTRVRGAIDFPLAGVAVALALADARVQTLRVALTGTNASPQCLSGTEAFSGAAVDEPLLAKLSKLIQRQVSPMRTTLVASNYRRQVAVVLAQRLVRELAS